MKKTQAEREEYLLRALRAAGRVSTRDAVATLGVSEATARRLFAEMERAGKVVRDYGGIVPSSRGALYRFEKKELLCSSEKQKIGARAALLVRPGDTIYLDCGTTTLQMALALAHRLEGGEVKEVKVITNSIANLQALSAGCQAILLGGEYNAARRDFSGALSEKFLQLFHFTQCFLGADGVSATEGFTSDEVSISRLNEYVIQRSDAANVLADASKLGRGSFVSYARLAEVSALVTNPFDAPAEREALSAAGVAVIEAE